jgi:hypothetical protein
MTTPAADGSSRVRVSLDELAARYADIIKRALHLNYIVRDRLLQEAMRNELGQFRDEVAAIKQAAIDANRCEIADLLFAFQCVTNSVNSSLRVWSAIHDGAMEAAWEALVDAQEYASIALRIRAEGLYGIQEYAQRLADIERVVFPGWPYFISPGLIEEGSGTCSICSLPYDQCLDHVEGLVYCGRLCDRVDRDLVRGDHTAFVELPHDKRCIIRHIATKDGRKRDYITWRVTDERFQTATDTEGGLMIDVIALTTKRLDVD